jgi:hypothetical protein
MSSKSIDEEFQEIPILDIEQPFKLRNAVISFSEFINPQKYIYYGYEKIPFHKRNPVYQKILTNEFAKEIKIFLKNQNK